MSRTDLPLALLVSSAVLLGAAAARAQAVPPQKVPVKKAPAAPVTTVPTSGALPRSFRVDPDQVIIGKPLTFTVTIAAAQTAAVTFKILSDLHTVPDISVPAGKTTASISCPLPPNLQWQFINYCITPDLGEKRYPCTHAASKKALVRPFDPATVAITRFSINGDSGTGTAVLRRGKAAVLEISLNAAPPAASITMRSDILPSYNKIIYANRSSVASDALSVDLAVPLGGKKGTGTITAELNGRAVARTIEILPLAQVDKVCLFDDAPAAGRYDSSFDYCTNEIVPARMTAGQTGNGFIRRGFTSREPVHVELFSSDASVAAVSPASASIPASQRGLGFSVKTVQVGGTPRTVTIKVIEGGIYEHLLTLTIQ